VSLVTTTVHTALTNYPTESDNSRWNTTAYPCQAAATKTTAIQFNVSTLGYSNIVIRWDHRVSNTASKYFRLQYSTDGATFMDFTSPVTLISSNTFEPQTNSLAAISGVNNNFYFAFRIVSEF